MKSTSTFLPRRAYQVQGAHTFIGVFGSGLAARCRVVTILDNYISCEILSVPACKERFAVDHQLGLIHPIEIHQFTNAEIKASKKLLELYQVQYGMNLAESERIAERVAEKQKEEGEKIIPLWPQGMQPAA